MKNIKKNIIENSQDILEFGLDQFINSEIIKAFPIVGTVVKIGFSVKSISDRIFLKKLEGFIVHYNRLDSIEINEMLYQIKTDDNFTNKVGESLILLLDRFSDLDKPEYMAKCFAAFIRKEISYDDFIRLGAAIDLSHSPDLKLFIKNPEDEKILNTLIRTGLTKISDYAIATTLNGSSPVTLFVTQTELGKIFLKIFVNP
ncbi:hypothetical protein ASG38_10790 [Flavobacterium sp. Leaf359]|uniref:hypothetical protein n=1 Tax=Flavobacterium sp. Leaf359 TaxID=1736351 RepID=UPI0006FB3B36|nr:hypothetical protein [Flavobacterium sp. Leaf359]KQS47898.1 hypothetical protein ASG38_10790 [Flavobacterium sp. Leaf359]